MLRIAHLFDAAGTSAEAESIRAEAIDSLANPALTMSVIRRLSADSDEQNLRRAINHVQERLIDNLDLLFFAIMTLELKRDFASAERICRAGSKAHPANGELQMRLADLLLKNGKIVQAVRRLTNLLRMDEGNISALKKLVAAHAEQGNFVNAAETARELVRRCPTDADAELSLASALRRSGSRQEALVHARRAAMLDPKNLRYKRYVEELERASARG
jgi:tetratricopeptide (TPR) repeat protein